MLWGAIHPVPCLVGPRRIILVTPRNTIGDGSSGNISSSHTPSARIRGDKWVIAIQRWFECDALGIVESTSLHKAVTDLTGKATWWSSTRNTLVYDKPRTGKVSHRRTSVTTLKMPAERLNYKFGGTDEVDVPNSESRKALEVGSRPKKSCCKAR